MGVDFVAVLGHRLDSAALQALPQALMASPEMVVTTAAVLEAIGSPGAQHIAQANRWTGIEHAQLGPLNPTDRWEAKRLVELDGPGGMCLDLAPAVCTVSCVTRWAIFLTWPHVQTAVRRMCYAFAHLLDSPFAIYVPDSTYAIAIPATIELPIEGYSLEEISAWLREHYGPPAPSLATIYSENKEASTWSGDGYYIDTFEDLVANPP